MHTITLKFTEHKHKAAEYMAGHKAWLDQGFADGAFLLSGSLASGLGGFVLAHGMDRDALEARVTEDPFVTEGVVSVSIESVSPARVDERMRFLQPD